MSSFSNPKFIKALLCDSVIYYNRLSGALSNVSNSPLCFSHFTPSEGQARVTKSPHNSHYSGCWMCLLLLFNIKYTSTQELLYSNQWKSIGRVGFISGRLSCINAWNTVFIYHARLQCNDLSVLRHCTGTHPLCQRLVCHSL